MNLLPCPSAFAAAAIVFLFCATLTTPAQETANPPETNFSRFRLIAERNIFNPNRSGRTAPPVTRSSSRPAQLDSFTLVGTLGDGQHWVAFFDGTRSELRGRLQLEDTIGDYTVSEISSSGVILRQDTNTVPLRVGMQLRRENEGPWHLADRSESTRTGDRSSPAESSSRTSSTSASTASVDDEVLRRLMQQRERELQ
ncbi:MAG: hypothetical protein KJ072_10190 [Verrucomicrobia bacterium]|nr:hypothetical protein [Verrucomicrobiota bacterium]